MQVGEKLGEGDEAGVRKYIKVGIVNTLLEVIILITSIYLLQDYYVSIFTSQQKVIDMFKSCVWLIMLMMPFYHLETVISRGILIAFGKQQFIAASLSFLSYGVGMPILFATVFFTELKASGIVLAFVIIVILQFIAVSIRLKCITISDEIEKTKVRVGDTTNLGLVDTTALISEGEDKTADKSGYGSTMSICKDEPASNSWKRKHILLAFLISAVFCGVLSIVSVLKV